MKAAEECLTSAGIRKEDITDIIFVSTTGLATPSMDALIINKMRLNQHVNRMSIFGLGCAGGVAGYAKACTLARANPEAIVLLVAVELCSLTFLRDDFSKSNFVGASLFSDGVAACLILGDNHANKAKRKITFVASESKLFYDSLDIMGWDFTDSGFESGYGLMASMGPGFSCELILLRAGELLLARRNEKWLLQQGAVEYGQKHYPLIVMLHVLFFISLIVEYLIVGPASYSLLLFTLFLLLLAFKAWVILSLGKFWNTKIYHIPGFPLIKKGPYKYFKHPNYIIVIAEIAIIPLIFHLYYTAVIFTALNGIMLAVRIKEENKALKI